MNFRRPEEECGIFGIYDHPEASNLTYLVSMPCSTGDRKAAASSPRTGSTCMPTRAWGSWPMSSATRKSSGPCPGSSAIGHVRYSTTGSSVIKNVQPIMVDYSRGSIAVAHNGNLVNAQIIKDELEAYGSIFQTTMDTEIIVHLLATSKASSLVDRLDRGAEPDQGGLLPAVPDRDHAWSRSAIPTDSGRSASGRLGDAYVVASESCALDLIEAEFVREIEPGEMSSSTRTA